MTGKVRIKATFSKCDGGEVNFISPSPHDGSVEDFSEPKLEGPKKLGNDIQFIIKVPRKARSTSAGIEETVMIPGAATEDFNPIETQGPVMVVQDPPTGVPLYKRQNRRKAA